MPHVGMNAHLLSRQAGYRSAGIHNVIHRLLQHLPQVAHEVPAEAWHFTALVGGAQTAHYAGVQMRRAMLDTESPLKRILWEQALQPFGLGKFDLYHALAFVSPIWVRQPMLVTVYDLTFLRYPERLSRARRLYLQNLTPRTCQRAERILAISQSTKDDLVELLGIEPDKISVTPLGYDQARMRPLSAEQIEQFKRAKGLPERFWLFIGTIEPRKNLPFLLEAYASLPPAKRLPLLIGGGAGWGMDELKERMAALKLEAEVRLLGFIQDEELPFWYNSAQAFVYPSVFEGFGLPVLEALACGTPVLTSNVSSLPEVAGKAGVCLPPDNHDAWAAALRRMADDDAWRADLRQAGLRQAQHFDWMQTARLTLAAYRTVLSHTRL